MKHYTKPATSALAYTDLMDERIPVSSDITVDPSEGLGRRTTDTWDFNEEASDLNGSEKTSF